MKSQKNRLNIGQKICFSSEVKDKENKIEFIFQAE